MAVKTWAAAVVLNDSSPPFWTVMVLVALPRDAVFVTAMVP